MLEMREELLNSGFLNFSDKRNDLQGKNIVKQVSF